MTDNTHKLLKQIDELRAIADTAMRFLENNRDEKRRMVKVSDHMAYLDLCNRYNRERESR